MTELEGPLACSGTLGRCSPSGFRIMSEFSPLATDAYTVGVEFEPTDQRRHGRDLPHLYCEIGKIRILLVT
jgi:hypothetical protein